MEVAKAAAKALATLGDTGKTVLENTVLDAGGQTGHIAIEALETIASDG